MLKVGDRVRVLRVPPSVEEQMPEETRQIDLTVATYALFGMMNWIYNWYNPQGKIVVGDLVDNVMRLFLMGFLEGSQDAGLVLPKSSGAGRVSVWREPQVESRDGV